MLAYWLAYKGVRRLKIVRAQRGLSQRQLEDISGVHHVSIARIEMGLLDPRLSTVRKLAKALNVTISELVGDKRSKKGGR